MFNFNEDLLQYIWKLQYYNFKDLISTDGEKIVILNQGIQNYDSGPDFHSAKVKIGKTQWFGNIEIHIRSSDWNKHKHFNDDAYDNVILHVVYEEDVKIYRSSNQSIPCIELKGRIPKAIFENYFELKSSEKWVKCENVIDLVDETKKKLWLEKLAIQRLQKKCKEIEELLEYTHNDWETALYILLGKYFGSRNNQVPFELLCKKIPISTIYKNKNQPKSLESLFYGVAGFLNSPFQDQYPSELRREYLFQKHKHNLDDMQVKLWKFFRLRPRNFPTIRIAQYIAMLQKSDFYLNQIIHFDTIRELTQIFDFKIHTYWDDHYVFDKESAFMEKRIGTQFQNILFINAIIPFIFYYGKVWNSQLTVDKAIHFMTSLPPERNNIINKWKQRSIIATNMIESQALLELKNEYCNKNRCLECVIGHEVLKENSIKYQPQKGLVA